MCLSRWVTKDRERHQTYPIVVYMRGMWPETRFDPRTICRWWKCGIGNICSKHLQRILQIARLYLILLIVLYQYRLPLPAPYFILLKARKGKNEGILMNHAIEIGWRVSWLVSSDDSLRHNPLRGSATFYLGNCRKRC